MENTAKGLPAVRWGTPGSIRYAHSGAGPAGERVRPAEHVLLAERIRRAGSIRLAERIRLAGPGCPPEIAHE